MGANRSWTAHLVLLVLVLRACGGSWGGWGSGGSWGAAHRNSPPVAVMTVVATASNDPSTTKSWAAAISCPR